MADARVSFKRLMQDEDDPNEPGAVTDEPYGAKARLGVNSKAHPELPEKFWGAMPYPAAYEMAFGVFKRGYWNPLRLDEIENYAVANKLANLAFNMGVGTVAKMLQRVVGVEPDGVVGLHTVNAVNMHDPDTLLTELIDAASFHYIEIARTKPELSKYLTAWLARARKRE